MENAFCLIDKKVLLELRTVFISWML